MRKLQLVHVQTGSLPACLDVSFASRDRVLTFISESWIFTAAWRGHVGTRDRATEIEIECQKSKRRKLPIDTAEETPLVYFLPICRFKFELLALERAFAARTARVVRKRNQMHHTRAYSLS